MPCKPQYLRSVLWMRSSRWSSSEEAKPRSHIRNSGEFYLEVPNENEAPGYSRCLEQCHEIRESNAWQQAPGDRGLYSTTQRALVVLHTSPRVRCRQSSGEPRINYSAAATETSAFSLATERQPATLSTGVPALRATQPASLLLDSRRTWKPCTAGSCGGS